MDLVCVNTIRMVLPNKRGCKYHRYARAPWNGSNGVADIAGFAQGLSATEQEQHEECKRHDAEVQVECKQ